MPDVSAEWELVSRRSLMSSRGLIDTLRRRFASAAADAELSMWTVRHRATGRVRQLTARTVLEARVKIANSLFDAA
jgi:hypothetical protein